jgi:hypothetical protein
MSACHALPSIAATLWPAIPATIPSLPADPAIRTRSPKSAFFAITLSDHLLTPDVQDFFQAYTKSMETEKLRGRKPAAKAQKTTGVPKVREIA